MFEWFQELVQLVVWFFDVIFHLDHHLNAGLAYFGPWMYLILFLVIFCETGLVVTPILPGDSLLFALGALCASENAALEIWVLWVSLVAAAIIGDAVNYAIGLRVGPQIFYSKTSKLLNREYLLQAQKFYEKYGGKTIIFARFLPIVRTFAPFVAGIGKMTYRRFAIYNVVGALAWVSIFLVAGYYFGNIPVIKRNFHIVIFAIIVISALPPIFEWYRIYLNNKKARRLA